MSTAPALAVALGALVALSSCASRESYLRSLAANDALRAERDALAEHTGALEEQNRGLVQQVQQLGRTATDATWVERQKTEIAKILSELEGSSSLGLPAGVSLDRSSEGVVLRVEGEVLFASGKVEITEGGKATLRALVAVLSRENRKMRIEGHTDSDPIVNSSWKSNLRLSAARAMSVADFLILSGVPGERVSISGYGQFRPKESGDSAVSKRSNRRVEILLLDR